MKLLNIEIVEKVLEGERFAASHGAEESGYQGAGMLYFVLPYLLRARTCVCLGSGSGYVPKWMSLGQQAAGVSPRRTVLVDANKPGAGGGRPDYFLGDLEEHVDCPFRRSFPEVEIVEGTWEAFWELFPRGEHGTPIDYLHIDADHRWEYVASDFWAAQGWLRVGSVVTLHDSKHRCYGVRDLVACIRRMPGHFEVMDFPVRHGVAVVRVIKDVAA